MSEAEKPSIYWRLSTSLTIRQAALLAIGIEPSSEAGACCEQRKEHERPAGYEAVKRAIASAVRNGNVKGKIQAVLAHDINGNECGEVTGSTDFDLSEVDFESLVKFFAWRNIRPPFFFPDQDSGETSGIPDYLNPEHPRYSAKLAAAVSAWEAVTDPEGRHPKQALEKWLRENAGHFGLTNEQGNPIKQAMDECSAVANWMPGGGAPKTPSRTNLPPTKA